MTQGKHTPVPWAVTINIGPEVESHCQDDGPIGICTLYNPERWGRDIQEAAANSYLIAAAPESTAMLNDLADVIEAYLVDRDFDLNQWIHKARLQAAIALGETESEHYHRDAIGEAKVGAA